MPVTQTFTYMPDGFVFEFVRYGDGSTACRLMPDPAAAAPVAPPSEALPMESPPASAAAPEEVAAATAPEAFPPGEVAAAAPYTKKQRTFMGTVRAGWVIIFSMTGEGVTYAADNLAGIGLPPGTGMIVGATIYGAKRAIWPDTKL